MYEMEIFVLSEKRHDQKGLKYFLGETGHKPVFFEKDEELLNFIRTNTPRVNIVAVVDTPRHLAGFRLKITMLKRTILFINAIENERILFYFAHAEYKFIPVLKESCVIPYVIEYFFKRVKKVGRAYRIFSGMLNKREIFFTKCLPRYPIYSYTRI